MEVSPTGRCKLTENHAGISLYRALLKQCSAIKLTNFGHSDSLANANTLSSLVRFRFQHDRSLLSPSKIANGIKAGYSVLDLLYACNRDDQSASNQIKNIIGSTAAQAKWLSAYRNALASERSPTSPSKLGKIAHLKAGALKVNNTRYHESKPILERPLPLSEIRGGRRNVPELIATHGVPFLRYSKPQPASLSRIIRQRGQRHQKWWTQKEELEADRKIAEWEDDWDEIVEAQAADERTLKLYNTPSWQWPYGSGKVERSEETWSHEPHMAETEVMQRIRDEDRYYADLGKKMWEVVVKERELAVQEKREAKIQKRTDRKAALGLKATETTFAVAKVVRAADNVRNHIL